MNVNETYKFINIAYYIINILLAHSLVVSWFFRKYEKKVLFFDYKLIGAVFAPIIVIRAILSIIILLQ